MLQPFGGLWAVLEWSRELGEERQVRFTQDFTSLARVRGSRWFSEPKPTPGGPFLLCRTTLRLDRCWPDRVFSLPRFPQMSLSALNWPAPSCRSHAELIGMTSMAEAHCGTDWMNQVQQQKADEM
jgi:hypothetical protein